VITKDVIARNYVPQECHIPLATAKVKARKNGGQKIEVLKKLAGIEGEEEEEEQATDSLLSEEGLNCEDAEELEDEIDDGHDSGEKKKKREFEPEAAALDIDGNLDVCLKIIQFILKSNMLNYTFLMHNASRYDSVLLLEAFLNYGITPSVILDANKILLMEIPSINV
ncbi:MAG TPA: hypothetical protein VIY47_03040, partial [Ignavibacteriaceae bacterium]